ncbi:MAG: hypothetical protein MN733_18430, partial [Nitrososphaera sp.]|nr:hypothetical protein [Nitrososphaera sp.]
MGLLANLRSLPRNALLLLLAGLALRVALVSFHQRPIISDEKDYHRLAVSLSTTAEYSNNGVPTAYRPIVYPAFVAIV